MTTPAQQPSEAQIAAFYQSRRWTQLSYAAKVEYGKRCQCCGATPEDGVKIVSDHIAPIRFNWDKRFDLKNIQVLCEPCNLGKGSSDKTDHRPAARSIYEITLGLPATDEARTRLKRTLIDLYSEGRLTDDELAAAIRDHHLVHA